MLQGFLKEIDILAVIKHKQIEIDQTWKVYQIVKLDLLEEQFASFTSTKDKMTYLSQCYPFLYLQMKDYLQ